MKKTFIYFLGLFSMAFFVASCNESTHEPGEPDVEGCYGVYFPEQDTNLSLSPSGDRKATILVARTNTEDAIQVPVEVTDTSGIFIISELYFEEGEEYSEIVVSLDNLETETYYSCSFHITDPLYASYYNSGAVALDITVILETWELLGTGQWNDYLLMSDVIVEVEVAKSGETDGLYRVYNPWPTDVVLEDWEGSLTAGSVPSYLDFTVNSDGTISWGNTTYSGYSAIATGYTYTGYGEIYYFPPAAFGYYDDEYTSQTYFDGTVFEIVWYAYIPDYGGGFGLYAGYLAMPDYEGDLGELLGY